MIQNPLRLTIFLCALLGVFLSVNTHAGISIIVTAPPPLREVIVEPPGYTSCYVVPQGFYNGIWHYQQRVCEYDNNGGPGLWVAGYWQCTGFAGDRCTRTAWVSSHWARPRDVEYRRYYDWNRRQHHGNRYVHGNAYDNTVHGQIHHNNHSQQGFSQNGNNHHRHYNTQNNHGHGQDNHHGHH